MKRRISLLAALAIVVTIVGLAAPAVFAQCGTAREIAMRQNGAAYGRIGVDTQSHVATNNNNTQVAIFWESGNPANNTAGPHMGGASTCDSQTANAGAPWWQDGGTGTTGKSIQMYLSSTGCTLPVCPGPGGSLTVLVEDVNASGSDAAYYLITTDETPGPIRYYDLARADPATQPSNDVLHPMWNLPRVNVQSSSGPPPNTTLTNAYANVDIQIWGVGPQGGPTQQVTSYDVFAVSAASPPARTRTSWGAPLKQVAYTNNPPGAPVSDSVLVPCGDPANNVYVAVGLTFDGMIPSYYVGAATEVECDPSMADPDAPSELRRARPSLPREMGRRSR